jgi:hypothetical protein
MFFSSINWKIEISDGWERLQASPWHCSDFTFVLSVSCTVISGGKMGVGGVVLVLLKLGWWVRLHYQPNKVTGTISPLYCLVDSLSHGPETSSQLTKLMTKACFHVLWQSKLISTVFLKSLDSILICYNMKLDQIQNTNSQLKRHISRLWRKLAWVH